MLNLSLKWKKNIFILVVASRYSVCKLCYWVEKSRDRNPPMTYFYTIIVNCEFRFKIIFPFTENSNLLNGSELRQSIAVFLHVTTEQQLFHGIIHDRKLLFL